MNPERRAGEALVYRYHQIPATPEALRHRFAPLPDELGQPASLEDTEILLFNYVQCGKYEKPP